MSSKEYDLVSLALSNDEEKLFSLINKGADVNQANSRGLTALFYACDGRRAKMVSFLLSQPFININTQDTSYLVSPFHITCYKNAGDNPALQLLICDGRTNVNIKNCFGWTTLMYAAYFGFMKSVKILFSFARNINVDETSTRDWTDQDLQIFEAGSTALDIASLKGHNEIASIIKRYKLNPLETVHAIRKEINLPRK